VLAEPKRGVHNVHSTGFGSGRTATGLGRTPYVFGTSPCFQGLEPGSSPTSGTCYPCSGAFGPLNVYKSPLMGPAGPIFVGGRCGLAAPSLGLDSGVAAYSFMAGRAWNCMTCCNWGSALEVGLCSVNARRGRRDNDTDEPIDSIQLVPHFRDPTGRVVMA
jgi:hypothetical protein